MRNEKNRVWIHRSIWLVIILLTIFIPILVENTKPQLEIVSDEGYINEYYSSLNQTSLTITIKFNREVDSGYVTINFYDESQNLLDTVKSYFIAWGDEAEDSYILVDGKVDSYKIIACEIEPEINYAITYGLLLPEIIFFVCTLLLSYREYRYNNHKITVYAGWYHHVLRIDGEKFDEHNTLISHTAINLSANMDDGTLIDVVISLTNRITVKVNNKLLENK